MSFKSLENNLIPFHKPLYVFHCLCFSLSYFTFCVKLIISTERWLLRAGDKGLQDLCKDLWTVRKERIVPLVGFLWRTTDHMLFLPVWQYIHICFLKKGNSTKLKKKKKEDILWAVQNMTWNLSSSLCMLRLCIKRPLLKNSMFSKINPQERNSLLIYIGTPIKVNLNENVSIHVKLC